MGIKRVESGFIEVDASGKLRSVRAIYRLLMQYYPYSDLGNKQDPLDELFYILLSTRTSELYYQQAFDELYDLVGGKWEKLIDISVDTIARTIRSAGLARKKAIIIKEIVFRLATMRLEIDLNWLKELSDREVQKALTALSGIGHKVAKCVMLYSLDREVFPIDIHCARVGVRIGWFDFETVAIKKKLHEEIERAIPSKIRGYLHVKLVQHGRDICQAKGPECFRCPIKRYYRYYANSRVIS